MAHIKKTCIVCGAVHKICFKIEEYNAWQAGTPVQTAFPNMEPDKRELLISGICGPCFDAEFEEDEFDKLPDSMY